MQHDGDSSDDESGGAVGGHVETLTVEHSDGRRSIVDCSGMTGDQLNLLLHADSHATRTLDVLSSPAPAPHSRAMTRVSRRHSELQPTLSKLPSAGVEGEGIGGASAEREASIVDAAFTCVDLGSWWRGKLLGCSLFLFGPARDADRDSDRGSAEVRPDMYL